MRIVHRGTRAPKPMLVQCKECDSQIEVAQKEWRHGTYGGEEIVNCPVCGKEIVCPGTEYRGDF